MTLIFTKKKYEDVPRNIQSKVIRYTDKEVEIDDTGLTRAELVEILTWLKQEGYVES